MATPSEKHPHLAKFLEDLAGRSTAIRKGFCVPPPYGCGKKVDTFNDERSRREYTISGLCQECQDKIFGGSENT